MPFKNVANINENCLHMFVIKDSTRPNVELVQTTVAMCRSYYLVMWNLDTVLSIKL